MLIASHKIQIHTEGANIFPSGGLSQLSSTHQRCVQKSWCLQVLVKIPNTCNNVCQAFSSTCSAEHTLVFSVHTLFRRQSFSDLGLCMFQVIFLEIFNAFYMLFYFFLHLNSCNNESFYTSGLGLYVYMILIFWLDVQSSAECSMLHIYLVHQIR